jgi:hypothetical protein
MNIRNLAQNREKIYLFIAPALRLAHPLCYFAQ